MPAQTPSIPKGTRDFSPDEMTRRNYIFGAIKQVFQRYGYLPIETPAMETLSTLMGKCGEEEDKLLFKILNLGNFLSKIEPDELRNINSKNLTAKISEKGLRYDLTIPFARYVVQHQHQITFPFKRYQIQPVWRADRPQKSRYREFYQCDVDVIGSNSLLNEVELIQIIDNVFEKLRINTIVKINNRKILYGIAEIINQADKFLAITIAIDKLQKIGISKVNEELIQKGISKKAVNQLQPIINLSGGNDEKINKLKEILSAKGGKTSEIGLKGIEEIQTIFNYLQNLSVKLEIELDLTLARGLNYYTGTIIEVNAKNTAIGSICGGGRYDDLTGVFGLQDISGVGISFGADRIYDVLNQLNLFPENLASITKLMFVNFGKNEEKYCLPLLEKIRKAGINAEIYPSSAKIKKQMTYANNKNIPYVALIGENEMNQDVINLKNMTTGEQNMVSLEKLIEMII